MLRCIRTWPLQGSEGKGAGVRRVAQDGQATSDAALYRDAATAHRCKEMKKGEEGGGSAGVSRVGWVEAG